MASMKTVYEVFYRDARAAGPAGDCTHTARFGSKSAAETFARGKRAGYGGEPATVDRLEVPRALALRWGVA